MTPPPDDSTASAFRWCPVQQMGCHQCPAGCDIAAPDPAPLPDTGDERRRAPTPMETFTAGMFDGLINGRNGMKPGTTS